MHPAPKIRQTGRGGAGHVARMGDNRSAYGVLIRKPAEKRLFERSRRRWKNIIKVNALVWLRIRINGVLFERVINLLIARKMRGIS
jgi:hypothetical protein